MYNISLDGFIFSFLWHDYHHSRMRSGGAIAWLLPQTGCFSTTSLSMMIQTNMSCQRRTLGMSWMIWDSNLHHDLKRYLLLFFFSGCDLLFADETDDNLLPFFPSGSVRQKTINVPANQNCSFFFKDEVHVNYLRCDGTWKLENVADTIDLTSGWSISQLSIKV